MIHVYIIIYIYHKFIIKKSEFPFWCKKKATKIPSGWPKIIIQGSAEH